MSHRFERLPQSEEEADGVARGQLENEVEMGEIPRHPGDGRDGAGYDVGAAGIGAGAAAAGAQAGNDGAAGQNNDGVLLIDPNDNGAPAQINGNADNGGDLRRSHLRPASRILMVTALAVTMLLAIRFSQLVPPQFPLCRQFRAEAGAPPFLGDIRLIELWSVPGAPNQALLVWTETQTLAYESCKLAADDPPVLRNIQQVSWLRGLQIVDHVYRSAPFVLEMSGIGPVHIGFSMIEDVAVTNSSVGGQIPAPRIIISHYNNGPRKSHYIETVVYELKSGSASPSTAGVSPAGTDGVLAPYHLAWVKGFAAPARFLAFSRNAEDIFLSNSYQYCKPSVASSGDEPVPAELLPAFYDPHTDDRKIALMLDSRGSCPTVVQAYGWWGGRKYAVLAQYTGMLQDPYRVFSSQDDVNGHFSKNTDVTYNDYDFKICDLSNYTWDLNSPQPRCMNPPWEGNGGRVVRYFDPTEKRVLLVQNGQCLWWSAPNTTSTNDADGLEALANADGELQAASEPWAMQLCRINCGSSCLLQTNSPALQFSVVEYESGPTSAVKGLTKLSLNSSKLYEADDPTISLSTAYFGSSDEILAWRWLSAPGDVEVTARSGEDGLSLQVVPMRKRAMVRKLLAVDFEAEIAEAHRESRRELLSLSPNQEAVSAPMTRAALHSLEAVVFASKPLSQRIILQSPRSGNPNTVAMCGEDGCQYVS